jgi:DNA-binding GntR family transcriptional regulator
VNAPEKATGAMTRALQGLKTLIINGDLNPGEQIRQEEMAEQLKVSRVPLREAMNVLADQGLLHHRPHQGYFVTKRAPAERAQINRMLHLMETELMMTLRWPDETTLASLRALNEQMRGFVKRADIGGLIQANRQFHLRIFSLSPNNLILDEVRRLWSMAEPLMWSKYDRPEDRELTLVQHDSLIDALEKRDRTRCVVELEHHRNSPRPALQLDPPEDDATVQAVPEQVAP